MFIDVNEFIAHNRKITKDIDIISLERVVDILDGLSGGITFDLSAIPGGAKNRAILRLMVCGKITASCQKCTEAVEISIDKTLDFPVFSTEQEFDLALLDNENYMCDGIVASSHFDVLNFVEDELIMLLPIAPKHEVCPPIN